MVTNITLKIVNVNGKIITYFSNDATPGLKVSPYIEMTSGS